VRAVRRAADDLPTAELPGPLRPFVRWHPDRLLADRPRRVMARAIATDGRLRSALLAALDDQKDAGSPLERLLARHGDARTAALLTAWARFDDLAVLAADVADRIAAERQAAAEVAERSALADAEHQVRRLSGEVARLREERDALRRRVDAAMQASKRAERAAGRSDTAREEALARLVELEALLSDERRRGKRREVRLRDRIDAAQARARVDDRRAHEVAQRLEDLAEELLAALGGADAGAGAGAPSAHGDETADGVAEPPSPRVRRGIEPATPGRPCRLPGGVAGDTPDAVRALLQVPRLRLVIDGYNVTKDARGRPAAGLDDQRRWLIQLGAGVRARFGCRVTVVFDGTDPVHVPQPTPRGVLVLYSRGDQTADQRIVDIVADLAADACVLVVTSDRDLRASLTALDADVVTSGAFLVAVDG